MRHVYVVFNNDAALFACATLAIAEQVIAREAKRIRSTLERTSKDANELNLRLLEHHLHWRMIPYATAEAERGKRK